MNNEKILEIIHKKDSSGMLSRQKYLEKHYPSVLKYILDFANQHNLVDMSIGQIKWHIVNNLTSIPNCKECGKLLKFKNATIGYPTFCSPRCTSKNKDSQEKYKKTMLEKYGVEHNSQTESYKKQFKATMLDRYGVEHALQNKNIQDKAKKTTKERYGEDSIFKVKKYQQQIEQTFIERYGSKKVLSSPSIRKKINETVKKKYGTNHPMQNEDVKQKSRDTNLKKRGVEYSLQDPKVRKKAEKTSRKKYGTIHPMQNPEIRNKVYKTNQQKYGTSEPFAAKDVKDKIKSTNIERHGHINPMQNKEIKNKSVTTRNKRWIERFKVEFPDIEFIELIDANTISAVCEKGHAYQIYDTLLRRRYKDGHTCCTICNDPIENRISEGHHQVINFISSIYEDEMLVNDRKLINPLELDILLPDKNFAIEYNGVRWHNDSFVADDYHKNKTDLADVKNIHLVQIWEDDWLFKTDIVKSCLKNILRKNESIFESETTIREVTYKNAKDFLNNNHLQGSVNASIRIGLFYNDELISLMVFGKLRKKLGYASKVGHYEMYRFCNKLNCSVVGGASKLFKYFIRNYDPLFILSFADRMWSTGNIYQKLGFNFISNTDPDYFYVINGMRQSRHKWTKQLLRKKGYISGTEKKIMEHLGYSRIFGAGSKKYIWTKSV